MPLLSDPVQSANAWPLRVAARRGIRRILRAAGHVDVLHLRMADVGSLAAADVARELDIPVVFTVAPDPHAVIDSLDLSGRLTRQNFGEADGSSTTGSAPGSCSSWRPTRRTRCSSLGPQLAET